MNKSKILVIFLVVYFIKTIIFLFVVNHFSLMDRLYARSLISKIKHIQDCVRIFRGDYQYYPGDIPNASEVLSHLSCPNLQKTNGNGNGKVEFKTNGINESRLAWCHLRASGLNPAFFSFHRSQNITLAYGTKFMPQSNLIILGEVQDNDNEMIIGPSLTVRQAYYIDKKLDGGNPLSGKVRVFNDENSGAALCIVDGQYNFATKESSCILTIGLD